MIQIAIVEDESKHSDILQDYIAQYSKEKGQVFNVSVYPTKKAFDERTGMFDILFLDIELPDGDGMEIARELRKNGNADLIIFVTNLAQYAIKGYEVRAHDFIVKPLSYYDFTLKMSGALNCLATKRDIQITIKDKSGIVVLHSSEILYVEVIKHYLTYHKTDGSEYTVLGSFTKVCATLANAGFSLCNRCYLVNLKYVKRVYQHTVTVGKHELMISRGKRTEFIKDLNEFLAAGGGN